MPSFMWVIFGILLIIGYFLDAEIRNKRSDKKKKEYGFDTENCQSIDFENGFTMLIDHSIRKFAFKNDLKAIFNTYDFGDLVKYDLILDNAIVKSNGIGRAVVGGIVAGGIGAIVGSGTASSKQVISEVVIHLYLKSSKPITYKLHETKISKTSNQYPIFLEKIEDLTYNLDSVIATKKDLQFI